VVGKGEGVPSFVHIHDAAIATVALLAASPGVYNPVDDDPSPQNVWLAAFAKFVGSPAPPHMSVAGGWNRVDWSGWGRK
jgi:nucleoside-diphosphate-sugar epimerase